MRIKILFMLFIIFLIGIVDFTIATVYNRYFDFTNTAYIDDNKIGKVHLPNFETSFPFPEHENGAFIWKTNNMGFREDNDTSKHNSSSFRVIVVGDSHTDGVVNNRDSFPNIAETTLNEFGLDIEVINAGTGCFSLYQQHLMAKKLSFLKPDLIVYTFYTGNDYLEISHHDFAGASLTIDDGMVKEISPPAVIKKVIFKEYLDKYSTIGVLKHLYSKKRYLNQPKHITPEGRNICDGLWQSFIQASFFTKHPEDFEKTSKLHDYLVSKIIKENKQNHIQNLFILLPTKYQIERDSDLDKFTTMEKTTHLDPQNKFDDRVRKDMIQILDQNKGWYMDPYDIFSKLVKNDKKSLYWNGDHHLNTKGHKLLAGILTPLITKAIQER